MEYDKTYSVEEYYESMESREKSVSMESDLDDCCNLSECKTFFSSLLNMFCCFNK
jgi:hypothetical protein